MFPIVTNVKKGDKTYRYLRIIESYREDGRERKRVLLNLGRLDLLGKKLDNLVRSLHRYCDDKFVVPDEIMGRSCGVWGPILVARHLWEQVRMGKIIGRLCRSAKQKFDVVETAFVVVANRLTEPTSEHGLGRWLEHTYVCDRHGRRWEPEWLAEELITKEQRVKVAHGQLQRWYRTLDALLAAKGEIERALYGQVCDLFSLKVDLVFYDITSTYFQRRDPVGMLRRQGKSRDGRPREVQVVVGVVMANGWPIAHHVFPGNTADKSTLQSVVADLEERFGLRRVMVVADRGMVSAKNLEFLSERDFHYLVGLQGRRNREAAQVLGTLRGEEECWERVDDDNRVQEVVLAGEGVRYFVVESRPRKAYEESLRLKSMKRVREALEKIERAVSERRLRDPVKIAARAARAMSKNHGSRYFSYEVPGEGQFRFHEDPTKMAAELAREGRYILKTADTDITALDAVEAYKELATVEAGFRDLKDVIDMRPVWHKTDKRICAHIFVATLALFLKRALEHQLEKAGVYLSATEALAAMRSVSVSELDLDGRTHRLVSTPGRDARRVLRVLGIQELDPGKAFRAPPKRRASPMW